MKKNIIPERNIEFKYVLEDAGWANAYIVVGNKKIIFYSISYLCSPINDLLKSLRYMLYDCSAYKTNEASFEWEDEPGGYYWILKKIDKKTIQLIIVCLALTPENKTGANEIVLDVIVDFNMFIKAIIENLDLCLKEIGLMMFKHKWNTNSSLQFPISDFLLLKFYLLTGKIWDNNRNGKDFNRNLKDDIKLLFAKI
jgi:hypothetical protein